MLNDEGHIVALSDAAVAIPDLQGGQVGNSMNIAVWPYGCNIK